MKRGGTDTTDSSSARFRIGRILQGRTDLSLKKNGPLDFPSSIALYVPQFEIA